MNEIRHQIRSGWAFLTKPDEEQREILAESRPFLMFLTIVLTASFAVTVAQRPSLREPEVFIVLTTLMTLHLLIHWISGWSALSRRLSVAYVVVQGFLAMGIVFFSGAPEIGFGLFAALVGEVIGIFGMSRLAFFGAAFYVILQPLSFYMAGGVTALQDFLPMSLGISAILIVMMVLIRRSLDSGDRAKALLAELEETHARLAEYAAQVETLTLKEERARMARDLHDTLAQGLAGLVMQLEAAQHHLSTGNTQRSAEIIEQAMGRSRTTLAGARQAIDDLRSYQDSAVGAMVQQRLERFAVSTGIRCDVSVDLLEDLNLNADVVEHIDHILGECLANIAVHAQAKSVRVRLSEDSGGVRLEIADDGVGFAVAETKKPGHYGLLGMRERAWLAGGNLTIESAPGSGCRVTLELPHKRPAGQEAA